MTDDTTDTVLASLLAHKLRLSLKAIEMAKDAAFRDLPLNERRTYLRLAEQAVRVELKGHPS